MPSVKRCVANFRMDR